MKNSNSSIFEGNDVAHAHLALKLGLVHGKCTRNISKHVGLVVISFRPRGFSGERRESGDALGKSLALESWEGHYSRVED